MSDEYSEFFDDIIISNEKTFCLNYKETFKEGDVIKFKEINETLELIEVKSPLDLIIDNPNIESVDWYPKNIFSKLFKKREKIKFEGDENHFVMISEKTKSIFNTNCKTFEIKEDNKVIIGKRGRLIISKSEGKLFANIDFKNYKTILIN